MSAIVEFLEGRGMDAAGRTLSAVLTMGNADLEHRHDFIQWLFPLCEPSNAVPGSPVLDGQDVDAIRNSGRAQANLTAAVERMSSFYGQTTRWLVANDHNHLRITRIVKSLRLLAGDRPADAFRRGILERVDAARAPVNAVTRRYWAQA